MTRSSDRVVRLFIVVLVVLLVLMLVNEHTTFSADPVLPQQPHTDTFEYSGGSLQQFNPQTQRAKARQMITYRLSTISGCNTGQAAADMILIEQEAAKVGVTLSRNDAAPHFTVFMSCGNYQVSKCGSVNTFCLPDRFPYNTDVYMSDIMYNPAAPWPLITRISIYLHEVLGHGIGTWEEQYCKTQSYPVGHICRGLTQFTPAPNWRDVMNTGSFSRHVFEDIEFDRWERTMYSLQVPACSDPCWDGVSRWVFSTGWSFDPATGAWHNPQGLPEWLRCNNDSLRYNPQLGFFAVPGSNFYVPSRGFWSQSPAC